VIAMIVLVAQGAGQNHLTRHRVEWPQARHPDSPRRVVREAAIDLSAVTAPWLLDIGSVAWR
jgi:hypothetical protein